MKRYIYKMSVQATLLMKRALAILLVAGAFVSCVENPEESEVTGTGNAYINLNFSTSQATTSRASDEELKDNETAANPSKESEIHSIRVWAFESGSGEAGKPIAYQNKDNIKSKDGKYTLNMKFLRKSQNKEVNSIDLYILANAETIINSSTLNIYNSAVITRKNLKDALLSAPFGIKDKKAETTKVPNTGLPISRAITNISVTDHCADTEGGAATKSIKIPLIRAVSKLHFFFARKQDGNTDNVKVTKVIVDGNIIPKSSFVFPNEETYNDALENQNATRNYDSNTQYEEASLYMGGISNGEIAPVSNPLEYKRKNGEAAQTYMERLKSNGIESHDLCYLRETNKAVKGKIYYRLGQGGEEKSQEFSIPTDENAIRNRELAVYGYFQKGETAKLYVQPIVMDWEDGGSYSFSTSLSINTEITPGKHGADVKYNDAFYGPKLKFTGIETNGKSWVLQTDNPDFGFIYKSKVNEDGSYNLNDVLDVIKGDINTKESQELYIVPKSELDWAKRDNYTCQVFMIAYSPNEKVIINSKDGGTVLPGTKTEILFTQVK